jgi:hypothetical protein
MISVKNECLAIVVFVVAAVFAQHSKAVDLIGYVPDYRMFSTGYVNNILPKQLPLLDEVRYFGITVDAGGSGALTTTATHLSQIQTIKQKIDALPAGQRPRLNITLGGWQMSSGFPAIAADAAKRTLLSQNISALLTQTGATSVDIDWEHPEGGTQLNNYGTLLKRIKQEVGLNRRVYATVEPSKFVPLSVFDSPNAIDGITLMTYDLSWWANDPQDLNRGEHSLHQYAVDALNAWTDLPGTPTPVTRQPNQFGPTWGRSAPAEKLGIGLPFYGRTIGTSAAPSGGTAYAYNELVTGNWTTSDDNYYTRPGETVWLPGPDVVAQRVEFAHERGLNDIIIWELFHDLDPDNPDSLLRTAYETRESLLAPVAGDYDGDRDVDMNDFNAWKDSFGSGEIGADGNGDGAVDAADYVMWRKLFASGGGGSNAAVPEPHTVVLFCFAAFVAYLRRTKPARSS